MLGPYWDEKRQLVDSYYAHIGHLPFRHYGQYALTLLPMSRTLLARAPSDIDRCLH